MIKHFLEFMFYIPLYSLSHFGQNIFMKKKKKKKKIYSCYFYFI